ncbi:MAG: hypothetical protein ABIQ35_03640 [Verrucomicrobiota bacterium]
MNPKFRGALATASTTLAILPAIVFLTVRRPGPWALWVDGICSLLAGFGFSYAFSKNYSLKNLYGLLLAGFLFMFNFVLATFIGCSR